MDVHNPKQRSYNMSHIKSKNSKPELLVRKWLWNNGYRYRLHANYLPGKPDIIFTKKKIALFVHGCFWHKHDCEYFKWPATNKKFWRDKINNNVKRDNYNNKKLKAIGWSVIIVWECDLKKSLEKRMKRLEKKIIN